MKISSLFSCFFIIIQNFCFYIFLLLIFVYFFQIFLYDRLKIDVEPLHTKFINENNFHKKIIQKNIVEKFSANLIHKSRKFIRKKRVINCSQKLPVHVNFRLNFSRFNFVVVFFFLFVQNKCTFPPIYFTYFFRMIWKFCERSKSTIYGKWSAPLEMGGTER